MTTEKHATTEAQANSLAGHHGRIIDLSVTVPETPEQVWRPSPPGISSWYVPTQVPRTGAQRQHQRGGSCDPDVRHKSMLARARRPGVRRWRAPRGRSPARAGPARR